MKKIFTATFWIMIMICALFWHPFKQTDKYFIYKLTNFNKHESHHQYLLLKNKTSTPIYNDMNIKGPFDSVIQAHQSENEIQNDAFYGELHYLPIVRKHYAN